MFAILKERWKLIALALFASVAGVVWMGVQVGAVSASDPHAIYQLAIQQITVDTLQHAVLLFSLIWVILKAVKGHVPLSVGRVFLALFKSGLLFLFGFALISVLVLSALSAMGVDESILNSQQLASAGREVNSALVSGTNNFLLLTVGLAVFWGVMMAWACTGVAWVVTRAQVSVLKKMVGTHPMDKPSFFRTFATLDSPFSFANAKLAWCLLLLAVLLKMLSMSLFQYEFIAVVFVCHLLKMLAPMLIVLAIEQFLVSMSGRQFLVLKTRHSHSDEISV